MSTDLIKHTTTSTVLIDDVEIPVEFANDPVEGLSGRDDLAVNTGMLFDLDGHPVITMRGMKFSLDIIWIGEDKKVVDISRNTLISVLGNDTLYSPEKPAKYALEINAGEAQKRGIKVGNEVEINLLPNSDLTRLLVLEEVLDYLAKAVPGEKLEYLKPGENPPEGIQIQRGARGGRGYYPSEVTRTEEESTLEPTEEREVSAVQAPEAESTELNLTEKLPPTNQTPPEDVPNWIETPDGARAMGGSIPRYWYHRPPGHVAEGTSSGGLQAYNMDPKEIEVTSGFYSDKLGHPHPTEPEQFLWMSPVSRMAEGEFVIDITKLNNADMRFTGQAEGNLLHRGDISPDGIARRPKPKHPPTSTLVEVSVSAEQLGTRYGRIVPRTPSGEAPTHLYRVMDKRQYDIAVRDKVLAPAIVGDRIYAAGEPRLRYAEPSPTVLVAIEYSDDDGWAARGANTGPQGEWEISAATYNPIPISKVTVLAEGANGRELRDNYELMSGNLSPEVEAETSKIHEQKKGIDSRWADSFYSEEIFDPKISSFENEINNDIYTKTIEIFENGNLPEFLQNRLTTLKDTYPHSDSVDNLESWTTNPSALYEADNDPRHQYLDKRDKDLTQLQFDIADNLGLRELAIRSPLITFQDSPKLSTRQAFHYLTTGKFNDDLDETTKDKLIKESESIKEVMDKEQEIWKKYLIGEGSLRVYRGIDLQAEKRRNPEVEFPDIGSKKLSKDRILSSWTVSPTRAAGFGNTIFARTITADDIVASFLSLNLHGIKNEGEILLHNPEDEPIEVEVVRTVSQPPEKSEDERNIHAPIYKHDVDDDNLSKLLTLETALEYLAKAIPGEKLEYLKPGEQPPKGIQVQRGARGGRGYYPSEVTAVEEEEDVLEAPEEREIEAVQAPAIEEDEEWKKWQEGEYDDEELDTEEQREADEEYDEDFINKLLGLEDEDSAEVQSVLDELWPDTDWDDINDLADIDVEGMDDWREFLEGIKVSKEFTDEEAEAIAFEEEKDALRAKKTLSNVGLATSETGTPRRLALADVLDGSDVADDVDSRLKYNTPVIHRGRTKKQQQYDDKQEEYIDLYSGDKVAVEKGAMVKKGDVLVSSADGQFPYLVAKTDGKVTFREWSSHETRRITVRYMDTSGSITETTVRATDWKDAVKRFTQQLSWDDFNDEIVHQINQDDINDDMSHFHFKNEGDDDFYQSDAAPRVPERRIRMEVLPPIGNYKQEPSVKGNQPNKEDLAEFKQVLAQAFDGLNTNTLFPNGRRYLSKHIFKLLSNVEEISGDWKRHPINISPRRDSLMEEFSPEGRAEKEWADKHDIPHSLMPQYTAAYYSPSDEAITYLGINPDSTGMDFNFFRKLSNWYGFDFLQAKDLGDGKAEVLFAEPQYEGHNDIPTAVVPDARAEWDVRNRAYKSVINYKELLTRHHGMIMMHEFGHRIDAMISKVDAPHIEDIDFDTDAYQYQHEEDKGIAFKARKDGLGGVLSLLFDPDTRPIHLQGTKQSAELSNYATTNTAEYFAEAWNAYITDTFYLKARNPEAFEFFEALNTHDVVTDDGKQKFFETLREKFPWDGRFAPYQDRPQIGKLARYLDEIVVSKEDAVKRGKTDLAEQWDAVAERSDYWYKRGSARGRK